MLKLELKQKEAKTIKFTIKDSNGNAIDCSSATFFFGVKKSKSHATYKIQKNDSDFDKTNASNGIVTVNLNTTDLNLDAEKYYAELKIVFSASTNVNKSEDIELNIIEAVTD